MRDQRTGELTPVLVVEVRVESGRHYVGARQRLRREEEHVGNEEQLERPDERNPSSAHISVGQRAGTKDEVAETAEQSTVDVRERVEHLAEEPAQCQVAWLGPALAAMRAIGCRDVAMARGTGP